MTEIQLIPLTAIVAGDNDRTVFDRNALADLAQSLADHGLAQPIIVRPLADGRYEIVAGERRTRAARLLGWATIPALVRPMDDEQAAAIMLVENVQRADLNPIEEARAYAKRIDRFGWSQRQVAEHAQKSERHVADRLALLALIPDVQQLIACGQMRTSFGLLMAPLDPNRQILALRWFNEQDTPLLRQFQRVCGALLEAQAQEALFDINDYLISVAAASDAEVVARSASPFPVHPELPPFERRGTLGASLEAYLRDLHTAGHTEAALVVGTLYAGMLRAAFCYPPHREKVA